MCLEDRGADFFHRKCDGAVVNREEAKERRFAAVGVVRNGEVDLLPSLLGCLAVL